MVTPAYQGGGPALTVFFRPPEVSADGEHLLGNDFGGFAGTENDEATTGFEYGARYEFSRTPSGWSTESLEPPASLAARRSFVAASADLSRTLWELSVESREREEVPFGNSSLYTFALREATPGGQPRFTEVGPEDASSGPAEGVGVEGASHDLSHILLSVESKADQLWPGDSTREGDKSLYEYVGTGNREPVLVGVKNPGPLEGQTHVNEHAELISQCGTRLGSAGEVSAYNAISASGTIVYFTALHGEGCATPTVNELYARISGSHTVPISEPAMTPEREKQCTGPCKEDENEERGHTRSPAIFQGASEDGSKVFFTTDQPLVSGDKDTTNDLYEAELGESGLERLIQLSAGEGPTPGSGADVIGVARIAEDGSHVYFVAKGVLTKGPNQHGEEAEAGAYNLYDYETGTGHTAFVTVLLTTAEEKSVREALTNPRTEEIRASVKEELERTEAVCAEEHPEGAAREACDKEAGEAASAEETSKLKELQEEVAGELPREIETQTGVTQRDEDRPFEVTPDGQFLLFKSARGLTGAEDTSTVGQLFEYDAQTQALVRVSVGQMGSYVCSATGKFEAGYDCNGNTTSPQDAPAILSPEYAGGTSPTEPASALSLSADGKVFFTSKDALAPQAVDGRENIYEYNEGNVYLISAGDEAAPLHVEGSRLLGADEAGEDVFFLTSDPLVPQDPDTQANWYDARAGGGFPAPVSPAGCQGDACQGPLSGAPQTSNPGSTGIAEDNLVPPVSKVVVRPQSLTRAQKLAKALRACKREPKKRLAACEKQARRRYGAAAKKQGQGKR